MRRRRPGCGVLALGAVLWAAGVQAQTAAGQPSILSGANLVLDDVPMYTQGQPFSLIEKTTRTLMLADGKTRTMVNTAHDYRDSEGRFRMEYGVEKDGAFVARRITIFDPVALTVVSFDPGGHTAVLTHVEARTSETLDEEAKVAEQKVRLEEARRKHPEMGAKEALGSRTIAGEEAVGVRTTTMWPAYGDRRGVQRTEETWTSALLAMPLLEVNETARDRYERIVTELTRLEPDAELFRLPPGYVVKVKMRDEGFESDGSVRIGEGVTPPIAIATPEPEYSEEARGKGISGNVVVSLQVDVNGLPTHLKVVRGIGFGLDEMAMEAVSRYRFKPAMRGGKAVPYDMNIEVNFQSYKKH